MSDERIKELQKQIADLKSRWPAHSAPPAMMQQLDKLEEELERELKKKSAMLKMSVVDYSARRINPFDAPELAAGYEAWYEHEGRAAELAERELLGWLLADFPGAASALEIGVGTGRFARWLAGLGWQVTGVDISAPMLAEAARRGGARFVRADASALPFAAGTFDVALVITTLEFIPDPALALRQAARVARRGIVLGVLNRWSLMAWQRKRSGLALWQAAHFYSPLELADLARGVLRMHAGKIVWRTTLLPRLWPRRHSRLPCGAFIGTRVELSMKEDKSPWKSNMQ